MILIKVQDVIGVKRALREALREALKEALKDHVIAALGVVIVPVLLKDVIMMAHSMLRANFKTKLLPMWTNQTPAEGPVQPEKG